MLLCLKVLLLIVVVSDWINFCSWKFSKVRLCILLLIRVTSPCSCQKFHFYYELNTTFLSLYLMSKSFPQEHFQV